MADTKRKLDLTQRHNTRCADCKDVIRKMLENVYGDVKMKFKVTDISVRLEAYKGLRYYPELKKVFDSLTKIRGYKDFVRVNYLQRCDFYLPEEKRIVELDEYQHFTKARSISLANYPTSLKLGYDKKIYKAICESKNQHDNDKDCIFRDEQRAWYDTIRDFIPLLSKEIAKPTIRIPIGFFDWCSLDPKNKKDVERFKAFLNDKAKF